MKTLGRLVGITVSFSFAWIALGCELSKQFFFKKKTTVELLQFFDHLGKWSLSPAQRQCTYKEVLYCLFLLFRAAITKKLTSLWDNVVPSGAFADFLQ